MDFPMVNAFFRIPYGIYLLATSHGSRPQAMAVSWVSQVSYSPPLLMVALRHNRPAISAIQEQGYFSLNLLRAERVALVNRFKNPLLSSEDTLLFEETQMGSRTFYRLKDCLSWWGCQVVSKVEPGDHLLFFSEVLTASAEEGKPLITSDCGKTYIGQA
jgi:flavin reductase (DIM6/NTAB) family NADH-FMN oxidoreductase RutF